jgi:hypothetical protein
MSSVANRTQVKAAAVGKGRQVALVLLVVFGIALFLIAAPLFIVFAVGMVPTVVAFICDRERDKYGAIAVGAGNFAGVFPSLVGLALDGPTLQKAGETVTDIFSIAVMYAGAGAGWIVVSFLPAIVAVYINVTTESRIQRAQRNQQKLVDDWGPEVVTPDTQKAAD